MDLSSLDNEIKQEVALNINALLVNRCITKPGVSVSKSEQLCVAKCTDRYLNAFQVVSTAFFSIAQQLQDMQDSEDVA
ncbi:hypothetical protein ROZALSC1DRAFT_29479 [Rozella allomycis CSF55]|uniref:Mitochondrial import inner membrane translocase subunit n=1 Tax=Rozella allomycis (strain CSF55) TaxID=988480 RepID=A0A4P9YH44_ROZAC|nr:hypothetical protein ROZALSC1DRAFT_29479 [Rozella allomycis CSF55]